ncbi:LysR substrate-binding domain-containing protein [Aeromicrobium choanae]|uniref:DNA-binding transcriptional regulator, LysR family n=1 Tax=Aeromicrobium choanae TaxID=1736691 RepID=A0A1T4Z496_9ACTN|nr:LysR substrate-binding domain-containing protein [Aeromicrobium choanae]SKB08860.1 DNA-binding transcriptional regulator, LysR family [Aeromicrobium choanae]
MLDVRRLRLLRELQIRGTLASVAAALHQSPSSVSQQLSLLEQEVGVELLRKVGRRVQLTPQAEILVEHTSAVLERLERAESDLAGSLDEATGTFRLAVFQSVALALMPATLSILETEHPRLRVTMTQREPESALHETWAREFDLVIAEKYPGHNTPWHPELDAVDLTTDEVRLAVPPAGRRFGDITSIAGAADAPWVMEPPGVASRHFAEQACRVAGFEPDVRYETADLQAQISLIESGHAVALLPDLLWLNREPPVALHRLEGRPHRTIFTSARRASAHSPGVTATREALSRAVAEGRTRA